MRRSTPIDALIAFIVSSGLAAKRPPHICWPFCSSLCAARLLDLVFFEGMDCDMSESLPETQKSDTPKKRSLWVMWIAVAILVGGLLYGVSRALPNLGSAGDYSRFKTGGLASLDIMPKPPPQPTATFTNSTGAAINLESFRGKVILVNLWATWCALA
jgi:hypothetical protein